ncbi:SDR family NAD(P)-dependent oxidoreductase [Phenylobacterium sp.]|uniref:SDR family NAD(P)-dependent oxidoreductase n=1 Tax=Phenylobacterium sp. TaxID=1871053 RepID=UPI0025D196CC|nr:SDR family NAD(P)-dependent oxidoreductase [Phenylobacterium sp.]
MADHSPDPVPPPRPTSTPRFQGRVAVITGAARGIGRAHAVYLAREGCDLVLCDILEDLPDGTPYEKATQADFDETVRQVETEGVRCVAVKADVADPVAGRDLVERATQQLGRLDFLVANAALTLEGKLADMDPVTFATVLRVNVNGVFHVLAPALKAMTAQRRGRIVVIASGAGRKGEPEAGPYVASKWALIGLAKTAALEAAESGVTVNVVLPGPTDTPMMDGPQRWKEAVPEKDNPTRADYIEAKKDATPMGYAWVKAEDVAAATLFLLTDEARFISGDTLSIDAADVATWT